MIIICSNFNIKLIELLGSSVSESLVTVMLAPKLVNSIFNASSLSVSLIFKVCSPVR
jgi:hypothetical protein